MIAGRKKIAAHRFRESVPTFMPRTIAAAIPEIVAATADLTPEGALGRVANRIPSLGPSSILYLAPVNCRLT
jgi:hypothetical protein